MQNKWLLSGGCPVEGAAEPVLVASFKSSKIQKWSTRTESEAVLQTWRWDLAAEDRTSTPVCEEQIFKTEYGTSFDNRICYRL